jgi:leader peptidase (prepilin peptidase)/N-methyltransferase
VAELPEWFFLTAVGLFGLLFGSMANVIIWRVPRGESIVSPGSHCPACGAAIRWYDNVPVVAWIRLHGRCRDCAAPISGRYPLVEAFSGVLWVSGALLWGMTARAAFGIALFYLLMLLTFVDLDTFRLPNVLVGALVGVGSIGVALAQFTGAEVVPLMPLPETGLFMQPAAYAALGIVLGAGTSGLIGSAYAAVRGSAGMGMGDIKLLGALGIFLGPYVLMALVIGSIFGAVSSVFLIKDRAEVPTTRIPFGPFLAVATVVVCRVGVDLWTWYAHLIRLG